VLQFVLESAVEMAESYTLEMPFNARIKLRYEKCLQVWGNAIPIVSVKRR
jgi:hypothetical protein